MGPVRAQQEEKDHSQVEVKILGKTHKYRIRVLKSMKQAKEIDEENGNTLWIYTVRLEMKNVRIAFNTYEGDTNKLMGYQEITGHIVFDINLGENFR